MDSQDSTEQPAAAPEPVRSKSTTAHAAMDGAVFFNGSIFDKLVKDEEDVIGLLAYSLSMQNKRDWFAAFKAETGREPAAAEINSYDIGERIERRLVTYRKLAEYALSGKSFWASATLTPVSELPGAPVAEISERPVSPRRSWIGSQKNGSTLALVLSLVALAALSAYVARHYWGA